MGRGEPRAVEFDGTGHLPAPSYYGDAVAAGREELVVLIADGGGGSGPGSMALQVAPEDLLAAAQSFEAAAKKAQTWLNKNSQDLVVEAAGADIVSTNVAGWLSDNANGVMGALPAVQTAANNLFDAANQMRATAASCGVTEDSVSGAITSAADSA